MYRGTMLKGEARGPVNLVRNWTKKPLYILILTPNLDPDFYL